jgi:ketosteroid isomerase-like protein
MGRADFDPRKRLEEYHAALDRLDFEAIEAMFAPDAVYVSNGVGSLKGRGDIIAAFREYFGEYRHEESVDTRIETLGANEVRSHWRLKARDTSGKVFRREGIETVWFGDDGAIITILVDDA